MTSVRFHAMALTAFVAIASSPAAFAQNFNIDAGNANPVPATTFGGATTQTGTWNQADCTLVTPIALLDVSGVATSTTLTIAGTNFNFTFPNALTTGNDELLMDDVQDLSGVGPTSWTIGPLNAGTYTVTVYAWAPDVRTDNTTVTVVGGALGAQICGGSPGFTGYVLGQTHVQDTVTVGTGGTIQIDAEGATPADYGSIDGVQIHLTGTPPLVYCTSGTTTNGCAASLTANNNPSVSFANPCVFTATNVEGAKQGIIFYGLNNTGFTPTPWGSGSTSFLCVKGPTQRMNPLTSGGTLNQCNGVLTQDWNAFQTSHPGALGNPYTVGSNAFVQAWFRDPPAVKTTSLSNAVKVTFVP
jgi:hypothetical protein